MEKTTTKFNHEAECLLEALGIPSENDQFRDTIKKALKNFDRHSESLVFLIGEAKTPEELAFLAFKMGQVSSRIEMMSENPLAGLMGMMGE